LITQSPGGKYDFPPANADFTLSVFVSRTYGVQSQLEFLPFSQKTSGGSRFRLPRPRHFRRRAPFLTYHMTCLQCGSCLIQRAIFPALETKYWSASPGPFLLEPLFVFFAGIASVWRMCSPSLDITFPFFVMTRSQR